MIRSILLLLAYLLTVDACSVTNQNTIQQASFEIFKGTYYVPSKAYNYMTNITMNPTRSVSDCAQKCLQNSMCMTATYYFTTQTCSLYREKRGLGQVNSTSIQTASVISLNSRSPQAVFCAAIGNNYILYENQFIYSANQLFALGIATPQWGIFNVDALGHVQSVSWQPAGNIPGGYQMALQSDGNVVLYSSTGAAAWASGTMGIGAGLPYGYSISNNGKLTWTDRTDQIILQRP